MKNLDENQGVEKLTLIELDTNSLSMRMNRFVLGRFAPDPKRMVNYCPIFWLTVCSAILLIPVSIIKLIGLLFNGFGWILEKLIFEPLEKMFFGKFEEGDSVYKYEQFEKYQSSKIPKYIDENDLWTKWDTWLEEECKRTGKTRGELLQEFRDERQKRLQEERELKIKRKEKFSWKMPEFEFAKKLSDNLDDFIEKTQDTIAAQKMLIQYTKKFLGALVWIFLGTILYFVVTFIGRGLIWVYNIWNWEAIFNALNTAWPYVKIVGIILIALAVAAYIIVWLYNHVPSNNLFSRIMKSIVIVPLYYIFVGFFWNVICVSFFYNILLRFLVILPVIWLIQGIVGVGPLFKEYFGNTYTDYCPGVKWVDKSSKNN